MRTLSLILVPVLLAIGLFLPGTAAAQQLAAAEKPPVPCALAAAGGVPTDADLVMVVENATELRATAVAELVGSLFENAGQIGDPRQAWQGLARELGWQEDEAFDRLLGRRLMLVARGIDNPETARWVLLSQVSMATDARLKERLKAAPRGIAQGQQVLAIEQGRFEITSHRQAAKAKWAEGDDRDVTVLLAPTGRSEMLDAMLTQLVGKGADIGTLRDEPAHAEAVKLGRSEVLLLARLGARPVGRAARGEAWTDFLVVSASRVNAAAGDGRWTARVALRERSRQQKLLDAGMSSDAFFAAMSPSSLLTIVQMAPLATIFGRTLPFDDPLTGLPWPESASQKFTGKQAIRVHVAPADAAGALPGPVCLLAMEATDGGELAAVLDPAIAQFFEEVERAAKQRTDSTPPIPDFAGVAPLATRVLAVEFGSAGPLAGVTGPGLGVAWAFPATGQGRRAWWTLAMAGSGDVGGLRAAAAVREAGAAIGGACGVGGGVGGVERRWIWLMASRPRELEAILAPGLPDFGGIRGYMRRMNELGCRLSISENGDIEGELTLQLFEGEGR